MTQLHKADKHEIWIVGGMVIWNPFLTQERGIYLSEECQNHVFQITKFPRESLISAVTQFLDLQGKKFSAYFFALHGREEV